MVGTAGRGVTKIKVVAVDDDPLIRELLSIGLRTKSDSLAVDCVGDGFEALELISTQQPDVVITDLDMPRFSGADFAKELERLHPGTPLVIFFRMPARNRNSNRAHSRCSGGQNRFTELSTVLGPCSELRRKKKSGVSCLNSLTIGLGYLAIVGVTIAVWIATCPDCVLRYFMVLPVSFSLFAITAALATSTYRAGSSEDQS